MSSWVTGVLAELDGGGWRLALDLGTCVMGVLSAPSRLGAALGSGRAAGASPLLAIASLAGCALAGTLLLSSALLVGTRLQRLLMYLHWVPLPFTTYWLPYQEWQLTDLCQLSLFRLRHIARTIQIATVDGEVLQGWHAIPSQRSTTLATACAEPSDEMPGKEKDSLPTDLRESLFEEALADVSRPAVLYLHGQGGTRGVYNRVELLRALASQLQAHVVALDYRGFGGSTGSPSEEGLVQDALAAWRWLRARRPAGIFVYGQSLGSAVALQLALRLETGDDDGPEALSGVILDAPFASAEAAALRHPLYRPLALFPPLRDALARALVDRWDSCTVVGQIACPLLIFGAARDGVVGPDGARRLAEVATKARQASSCQGVEPRLAIVPGAFHTNAYASDMWLVLMAKFLCGNKGMPDNARAA